METKELNFKNKYFVRYMSLEEDDIGTNYFGNLQNAIVNYLYYKKKNYTVTFHQYPSRSA